MTSEYLGPNVWYTQQIDLVDGQLVKGHWFMHKATEPEAYTDKTFSTKEELLDYVLERFPNMRIMPSFDWTDEELISMIKSRETKS